MDDLDERITFRRLGGDDVALMRQLLEVLADAFGDRDTYNEAPPGDAYLRRLLGRDGIIVLAALVDAASVAGLVAYELDKLEQERKEIYIYDLAVAAAYRRRGIATALIDALRPIAARRGAYVIFVQADVGDDPAIALYTKLGRRKDALQFDIDVGHSRIP